MCVINVDVADVVWPHQVCCVCGRDIVSAVDVICAAGMLC